MNSRTPPRKPETAHRLNNVPSQPARQPGGRRRELVTPRTRLEDLPESGITLADAAAYLQVSYQSLWLLVSSGQLQTAVAASGGPANGIVRFGRIWRVRPAAVFWMVENGLPAFDREAAAGDDE